MKRWLITFGMIPTVCLGACTTIQATPHLPSLIWQTPPAPATTQPGEFLRLPGAQRTAPTVQFDGERG